MSKVLVTGGAGFIGSNLTEKLLADGHTVSVWDNLSTGKRENLPDDPKLSFYEINVAEINPEKHIEKRFDIIYHLAAHARIQPSFVSPDISVNYNCGGTLKMLELARKHNIPLVYTGTSSYYHDKYANPYAFTKWMGEELCVMYNKVYKTSTVIARLFNVYGPKQIETGPFASVIGVFERCKRDKQPFPLTGKGEQRRDFTHVDDVVEGLVKLGDKTWNAEIFNFGTGKNYSIKEVARMFKPLSFSYVPGRPGEAIETKAEIKETSRILNWKPSISLESYIERKLNT